MDLDAELLNAATGEDYGDEDFETDEVLMTPKTPERGSGSGGGGGVGRGGRKMTATEILKGAVQDVDASDRQSTEALLQTAANHAKEQSQMEAMLNSSATAVEHEEKKKSKSKTAKQQFEAEAASSSDEDESDETSRSLTLELCLAANHGNLNKIEKLLDLGARVSERDAHGWSPIHWAASKGHVDCISVLLAALPSNSKKRSAVNKTEIIAGFTPLHLSIINQHCDAASMLIDEGASLTKVNLIGECAKDCLVLKGSKGRDMARILGVKWVEVQKGGNKNNNNNHGESKDDGGGGGPGNESKNESKEEYKQ